MQCLSTSNCYQYSPLLSSEKCHVENNLNETDVLSALTKTGTFGWNRKAPCNVLIQKNFDHLVHSIITSLFHKLPHHKQTFRLCFIGRSSFGYHPAVSELKQSPPCRTLLLCGAPVLAPRTRSELEEVTTTPQLEASRDGKPLFHLWLGENECAVQPKPFSRSGAC
jgi:hypothetical protein